MPWMDPTVSIEINSMRFVAQLERHAAPRTCAAFEALLPLEQKVIQARWSGEAAWIPLGDNHLDLAPENETHTPLPGQLLLYPGGISEVEILLPYGLTTFACKSGPLKGNHFLTIFSGAEQLAELGRLVMWEGAQRISFRRS